jgi:hypothetical protein
LYDLGQEISNKEARMSEVKAYSQESRLDEIHEEDSVEA